MARINRSSGLTNPLQKVFPQPVISNRAPTTADKNYPLGIVWVNKSTDQAYTLTSVSAGSATWALSSPGASDVDTLTGDGGGAISPAAGNITLAGGTNITSAGAGSTITFNLDAAISLATSVTSPIYTASAADLNINSATGQDVIIKMGDNAGANKVSFTDSDDAEVFAIDSNGSITYSSLVVAGAFTQTAGVVSISEDNSANAVGIANGTTARAVSIASSAAAHTVAIGSATGAASLDLKAGTGNFTLDGAGATTYTVGASTTTGTIDIGGTSQTGTITLGDSDGVNIVQIGSGEGATTVNIAGGATAAKTVNVATGAVANLVTIGSATGAASLDLLSGTGNMTADSAGTLLIDAGGVLELNSDGGIISIGNDADAFAVNIGTGAAARPVTVGSTNTTSATTIQAGTGALALNGGGALTADAVGVLELNSSGAAIGIGNDADAFAINVGTGAAARTITVGNVTGASSVVVDVGTGAASFGASATAHTTTIGSTTGASDTIIQSGTGNITLTGTVEAVDTKVVRATGLDYTFKSSPSTSTAADTAGVATGTTGATNILSFPGFNMEQFILGAGQTIIKPVMNASGLLCSLDLTATEGAEYNFGAARVLSEYAFTVGTSAAFFFEVTMTVADISGGNPYAIGFRKAEANNATFANYTDYYALGMFGGTSATNVTLASELNGGGQTLQDSTTAWTGGDGGTVTLKVLVSAAGVVTATIDGGAPAAPLAYTFDSTDVVCPFIRIEHGAVAPGAVNLVDISCGFQ